MPKLKKAIEKAIKNAKKKRRTAQENMEKAEAKFKKAVKEVDVLKKGKENYQGVPLRL